MAALDMLVAARRAIDYALGVTPDEFRVDRMRVDATMAALMIVGEASKRVSQDGRRELTGVKWRDLSDMRQYVVHRYFLVDPTELHKAVADTLTELVRVLEPLLSTSSERLPPAGSGGLSL